MMRERKRTITQQQNNFLTDTLEEETKDNKYVSVDMVFHSACFFGDTFEFVYNCRGYVLLCYLVFSCLFEIPPLSEEKSLVLQGKGHFAENNRTEGSHLFFCLVVVWFILVGFMLLFCSCYWWCLVVLFLFIFFGSRSCLLCLFLLGSYCCCWVLVWLMVVVLVYERLILETLVVPKWRRELVDCPRSIFKVTLVPDFLRCPFFGGHFWT